MNSGAPLPDLRVVAVADLYPHELHDGQRSAPLVARLREAEWLINPPIVAAMNDGDDLEARDEPHDRFERDFVVLDGANRNFAFRDLGYPHILAQVVSYRAGTVDLETWQHVVVGWSADALLDHLAGIDGIALVDTALPSDDKLAMAWLLLRDGRQYTVTARTQNLGQRNALLCAVVATYQARASLHRTAVREAGQIWPFYPDASVVVRFRLYQPSDIIEAARQRAYIAPGVSRHIVHGRALRVHYPMAALRDPEASLDAKNAALSAWLRDKLAGRSVRYYAESTYSFDE